MTPSTVIWQDMTRSANCWGDGATNDYVRKDPTGETPNMMLTSPYTSPPCDRHILSAEHHSTSWEEMLRGLKCASNQSTTSARLPGLCRDSGQLVGLSLAPGLWQILLSQHRSSPPQSISSSPALPAAHLPYLHHLYPSSGRWLWLKHQPWDWPGEAESRAAPAAESANGHQTQQLECRTLWLSPPLSLGLDLGPNPGNAIKSFTGVKLQLPVQAGPVRITTPDHEAVKFEITPHFLCGRYLEAFTTKKLLPHCVGEVSKGNVLLIAHYYSCWILNP